MVIIDDNNNRIFIITWNLKQNREHSLFQTTYAPEIFPENLIMKGQACQKQQNFNYFLDNGAIINLDNNLPVQFFDPESEKNTMPTGQLSGIEGMQRISNDRSRYLDITSPGRVYHFISYTDLLYWERFQHLKEKHEIYQGDLSTFSPIVCFPNGISVFHHFATDMKVLNALQEAISTAKQEWTEDTRVNMLPLVFLHSNPHLNESGLKTTPIHIALHKKSPISFECMLGLLVDQRKVCVTSQLLDELKVIINWKSQAVFDFFNNSFFITDQYDGLRALEWDDPNSEEMIKAISCAYLSDQYLTSIVRKKKDLKDKKEDIQNKDEKSDTAKVNA